MPATATALSQFRAHYQGEKRDLLRVVLNATSVAEANLALEVLKPLVPEKVLVCACNLREVLGALPSSPFPMMVDESTLARAAGLRRGMAVMGKHLDDDIELCVTTAGNLVLDIIIKKDGAGWFWNPVPVTEDYLCDDVLDLVIESDHLLDAVIDLSQCMGMVFNPTFYLSLEDWSLERAADMFEGLQDLF